MTVRRLRANQRGPRCSYCSERAVHRGCLFTRFACPDHLDKLRTEDAGRARIEQYVSDAEFYARIP
jgi:hypothetical protein